MIYPSQHYDRVTVASGRYAGHVGEAGYARRVNVQVILDSGEVILAPVGNLTRIRPDTD